MKYTSIVLITRIGLILYAMGEEVGQNINDDGYLTMMCVRGDFYFTPKPPVQSALNFVEQQFI